MTTLTTVLFRTVVSLAVIAVTVDATGGPPPAQAPPRTSIEAFEEAMAAMPCHTLGPAFRQGVLVGWRVFGDGLPRDVVQRGDLITGVNGLPPTPASFGSGLDSDVLILTIERDGVERNVVLNGTS